MPKGPTTSLALLGIEPVTPAKPVYTPTEDHLKDLSLSITSALNTRDFSHPVFKQISPSMTIRHEAGTESMRVTGADLLSEWKEIMKQFPNYHTDIIDVQTQVSEGIKGHAGGKVWILRTAEGYPDGLRREVVAEFTWAKREGKWWCVKYRGLRGISWYDSETFDCGELATTSGRNGSIDSNSDQSSHHAATSECVKVEIEDATG